MELCSNDLDNIETSSDNVEQRSISWRTSFTVSSFFVGLPVSAKRSVKLHVLVMLLAGSLPDFLVKTICESWGGADLNHDIGIAAVMTFVTFLASAIPPSFQRETRGAWGEMTLPLFRQLLTPALLDVVITSFRFISLIFLPPAAICGLVNSIQFVTVALLGRCRRSVGRLDRRSTYLNQVQWWSLLITVVGSVFVIFSVALDIPRDHDELGGLSKQIHGVITVSITGILGGLRDILEEVVLKEANLSEGAMHMVESCFSGVLVLIISLVSMSLTDFSGMIATGRDVVCLPTFWVCGAVYILSVSGRLMGRLKIIKRTSTIVAKILALAFPYGTWLASSVAFWSSHGRLGETQSTRNAVFRLVGFMCITLGCYLYLKESARPA